MKKLIFCYVVLIFASCTQKLVARAIVSTNSGIGIDLNGFKFTSGGGMPGSNGWFQRCYDHIDPSKYVEEVTSRRSLYGNSTSAVTLSEIRYDDVSYGTLIGQNLFSANLYSYTSLTIDLLNCSKITILNKPASCGFIISGSPYGLYDGQTYCYNNFSVHQYPAASDVIYHIPVKFNINGLTHFGWVSMWKETPLQAAYESIPGFPIKAGDTKGYLGADDPLYNTIKGNVFYDANGNCTKDASEIGIPNIVVLSATGNSAAVTDANGNYELLTNSSMLSVQIDVDTIYSTRAFTKLCPAPNNALQATFSAGGLQIVSNKNFAVKAPANLLEVNVSSDRRRRCFRNTTTVTYINNGINNTLANIIKVVMPEYIIPISSVPAWDSQNGDTLFYTKDIAALSKGSIKIIDSVACENNLMGLSQCTEVFLVTSYLPTPLPSWDQSDLSVSGIRSNDSVRVAFKNFGLGNMSDSTIYNILIDNIIVKQKKIKLNTGQTYSFKVPVLGKAIRAEVYQTSNHPEVRYRSFSMEGCGNFSTQTISKDLISQYPVDVNGTKHAISCMPIRDSYDPNDKQAVPSGLGTDHEILPNGDIVYTIRFQNEGNDDAYTVVVADTLSNHLELNSFQMLGASHAYKMEVQGKINPRITWIFGGINLKAKSVNEPLSHGYITYKISQKENLSPGTLVKNKADIFFDYNEAVITNTVNQKITNSTPHNLLQIAAQPQNVQTCNGNAAGFTIEAQGPSSSSFQWYKDGNEIAGATTSSLDLMSTSNSDIGNYKCRIINFIDTVYSSSATLNVQICTDINEKFTTNKTLVYPNPCTDNITISTKPNAIIKLIDITGRVLWEELAEGSSKTTSTENLPSGLYQVVIRTNDETETIAIVKK